MTPLSSQLNLASRSGRGGRNGREGFNQQSETKNRLKQSTKARPNGWRYKPELLFKQPTLCGFRGSCHVARTLAHPFDTANLIQPADSKVDQISGFH
jgi:hypothetical protein